MKSETVQPALRLAFGVHHAPTDAPQKLVRQCLRYDALALNKALAVSMRAGGHKAAYVAACIGKHESYISLLRRGKRPVTEKLVAVLCAATGSNLIAQVAAEIADIADDDEQRLAAMLREVA